MEKSLKCKIFVITMLLIAVGFAIIPFVIATASVQTFSNEKQMEVFARDLADFTEEWIEDRYCGEAILDEVIPIVNDEGLAGFCLEFSQNDTPNGYLVLANVDDVVKVVDYNLEDLSPYESLQTIAKQNNYSEKIFATKKSISTITKANSGEKVLYQSEPYHYGVAVQKEGKTFIAETTGVIQEARNEQVQVMAEDKSTPSDSNFYAGIITRTGSSNLVSLTIPVGYSQFLMTDFETNIGNCAPTCGTNIVMYWRARGYTSMQDANTVYNYVADNSNYDRVNGGATRQSIIWTIRDYVKSRGNKVSYTNWWIHNWNHFTGGIKDDYTVYLSLRSSTSGHGVMMIGYDETSTGDRYYRVIDGWYRSTNRYVIADDYYKTIQGSRFRISG